MRTATSAALALLLLASCATAPTAGRAPESQTALAVPEGDPAAQGTPRERPLVKGIQQVTVAAEPGAHVPEPPRIVRLLAPELTVAEAEDVHRAFEPCPWAPPPPGSGVMARVATIRVRTEPPPAR